MSRLFGFNPVNITFEFIDHNTRQTGSFLVFSLKDYVCYYYRTMTPAIRDRILVVENDPLISDLIARQTLQASGFHTIVVSDASTAIGQAAQLQPDAIIADLNLPGLSGKDLMVALNSQGADYPVIVLAHKGMEADIIQAFRLGAADYLMLPVREAEVVRAVERVLKLVHERREKDRLADQLNQTNQELQSRVREMTTIFGLSKAVISITDQAQLFEKVIDGAVRVSQADLGWFWVAAENGKTFHMMAHRNLPPAQAEQLSQPWEDEISALVAASGESLALYGPPLKRFKASVLGQAALITPVKVQKQVIGLMVVLRQKMQPFTSSEQHLLESVADYTAIALVNARMFNASEERVQSLQQTTETALIGQKIIAELIRQLKDSLKTPLDAARVNLDRLIREYPARLTEDQRQMASGLSDQLKLIGRITDSITSLPAESARSSREGVNLVEICRGAVERFRGLYQPDGFSFGSELPKEIVRVNGDGLLWTCVVDSLLNEAVNNSNPGGRVVLQIEKTRDGLAQITVRDGGPGMDPRLAAALFEPNQPADLRRARRFSGMAVSLPMVKELVNNQKGKIWAESRPGQGSVFTVTAPLVR